MERVILVRYGEIHLKGLNRPFFERKLLEQMKKSLIGLEKCKVVKAQGRFFVKGYKDDDEDDIINRLIKVFGVHSVSPALEMEKDVEIIQKLAVEMLSDNSMDQGTFKVDTRRSDKTFPLNSMELSRNIGGYILEKMPGLSVDVHHPDWRVNVEIREMAYVYVRTIPGAGGMPIGTNGRAVLLLSGGIDSPVAGWMIAKRGVQLEAVHFHSFPYTSERAKEKVIDLCKLLSNYCGSILLHVVPFTEIQQTLFEKCPDSQLTILMRRFMMRIAEAIAVKRKGKALVTGESIGQVASQTMESLAATDNVVSLPVFRPVIGFDKSEIIEIAQKIGTYETSILPYEDCCTVFVPKHPVTHPSLEKIEQSETVLNIEKMVQDAVERTEAIMIGEH